MCVLCAGVLGARERIHVHQKNSSCTYKEELGACIVVAKMGGNEGAEVANVCVRAVRACEYAGDRKKGGGSRLSRVLQGWCWRRAGTRRI